MRFNRIFAMPTRDTFSLAPLAALLARYCTGVVIDPFARNAKWGTHTNDLNPETEAQSHRDAKDFCACLVTAGVVADVLLFDPPYSPRQISECYQQIGRECSMKDTQNARLYKEVKDEMDKLSKPGTIAICCGWNSQGFGIGRGYELLEVLLIPHGAAHNDTIVTVERKGSQQLCL